MSRLCIISEKNKILKLNELKDFKWWSIRDLKECAPIIPDISLVDFVWQKCLFSRLLPFLYVFG